MILNIFFEVNVSYLGKHLFTTAPRSCETKQETVEVLKQLRKRFHAAESFDIHLSYTKGEQTCGTQIGIKQTDEQYYGTCQQLIDTFGV